MYNLFSKNDIIYKTFTKTTLDSEKERGNNLKVFLTLKLMIFVICIVLVSGIVLAEGSLSGKWEGAIIVDGQELGITINFKDDIDELQATIDIPLQGVKNYSLQNIKIEDKEIYMELPSQVTGEFFGRLTGKEIIGEYNQGMVSGDFYLQKIVDDGVEKEDQSAKELTLEEVSLEVDDGILYGTLQLPGDKYLLESRKHPVALIIAGSGPTDRNGNSILSGENNSLKMLAEGLAEGGIASLRYDKRMVAESSGINTSEAELRFNDYINDAVGWINKLQQDKRFSDVYVIGHSQGSLIGMVAVRQSNAGGFISIAGPGRNIAQILERQLSSSLPEEVKQESFRILNSLKSGETVADADPKLNSLFRSAIQPFLISYMKYDPLIEIRKLSVPVLIVQGTRDLQVSIEDAQRLKEANSTAELVIIENMNHVLKEVSADPAENIAVYNKSDLPLADDLVKEINEFIK